MKTYTLLTLVVFFFSASASWSQTKSNRVLNISAKTRLCPKDTRRGDREFSGNGPNVTATARLRIENKTRVTLQLTLHAIETKKDWTEAKGNWNYRVYQAPTGHKVNRIITDTYSEAKYRDTNHKLDVPKVTKGNLVRRFEIKGDTSGKDIGNCTSDDVYMNVRFNPTRIEIQKLEKIISRFSTLSDYPSQSVNKMSQDIRAVANDQRHWYFTQTESLWKIPISFDLKAMGKLQPELTQLVAIPPHLQRRGYRRFGDLDYYRGFVFVALEGDGRVKDRPLVAVFSTANMELVETLNLKHWQKSIGWIAINAASGHLYTSKSGSIGNVNKFKISIDGTKITLAAHTLYTLRQKNGLTLSLQNPQGGDFSADGRYLFLVDAKGNSGRLWSFNHRTGREMYKTIYSRGPEPRAVSFWNTGTKAPGISGALHLIMRYPNPQERDAFSLKHYAIVEGFDWNN